MKQFDIPEFYKSPIISEVKNRRRIQDPRKKDFSPTILDFGSIKFIIARHFGFCYGVENAIEISYKALEENKGKKIYLLSQMIHNPIVNQDLTDNGIEFLQDTLGNQLIPFEKLTPQDVVIIPAFGTTVEMEAKLKSLGVDVQKYNTTCPFVEKVWKRSAKLGDESHSIIIHGKHKHEETRATFSHSSRNAPSLVVKNIEETRFLGEVILGNKTNEDFYDFFKGKYSPGFNPEKDLLKVGVVNQTTMLATETQEIADYTKKIMLQKFGEDDIKNHFADTRDTLCYATNDNQSATLGLMEQKADLAIVVGGYNSSNTTHLVELLEQNFSTYFISSSDKISNNTEIEHFDIHKKKEVLKPDFLPKGKVPSVILTSGASCPDAMVDKILQKLLTFVENPKPITEVLKTM